MSAQSASLGTSLGGGVLQKLVVFCGVESRPRAAYPIQLSAVLAGAGSGTSGNVKKSGVPAFLRVPN
jgi:hypothetical protein